MPREAEAVGATAGERAGAPLAMTRDDPWKFPILLVSFVMLLVVQPFLIRLTVGRSLFDALYSIALVATIHSLHERWRTRLIALSLGLPNVLSKWIAYFVEPGSLGPVMLLGSLFEVVFFGFTAAVIVRMVLTNRPSAGSIPGAFCAYLMIGIAWAGLYSALTIVRPDSFRVAGEFAGALGDVDRRSLVFLLFSFATLTTIGNPDIVAVTPQAGTLAWVEAMLGQFYIAVFVAGLVGLRHANAPHPPQHPPGQDGPPDSHPPG